MNKVKRYIQACHICLKTKPKYTKNRPVYGWILVDYAPMQDLSIDIKIMPQAFWWISLLLVITCDQTNFTIAVPLRDRQTQTIAEELIYRVIYLFGLPRWIVCVEAAEITSAIIQAILTMLNCRLKVISPYNHGSGKCERQIKTIGPLFVDTAIDKTHYRLKDATGLLLDGMYHVNIIKKGSVHTLQGIVDTFDGTKRHLKTHYSTN